MSFNDQVSLCGPAILRTSGHRRTYGGDDGDFKGSQWSIVFYPEAPARSPAVPALASSGSPKFSMTSKLAIL